MSQNNPNELDNELSGLFNRATTDITPNRDIMGGMNATNPRGEGSTRGGGGGSRRGPAIAGATISAVVVVALIAAVFFALRSQQSGSGGNPGIGAGATATPLPLSVTSVNLVVNPTSIAGMACGANLTLTYTATFALPAHNAGGTIQYNYTTNNGRSQTPGSIQVAAGQTSATATFTDAGTLTPDNTWPGVANVMVTSPNSVLSNAAQVSGTCAQSPGVFSVKAVAIAVDPLTLNGQSCGSAFTENYIATFALAPNGPGGTIQFMYTTDNGRGSTPTSLNVAAGQTIATYTFKWSGVLPADHTAPGNGAVTVTAPNAYTSQLVGPTGQCS